MRRRDGRRPIAIRVLFGALLPALFTNPLPLSARAEQATTPDRAVQRGQEALASGSYYPWYDATEDKLAPMEVRPAPDRPDLLSKLPWKESIEMAELLGTLAWIALGVLLVGMTALLIMAFLKHETGLTGEGDGREVVSSKVPSARMESLPPAARANMDDLFGSARTCYQQADYARAALLLFSHQLVELDRAHRITLARGKTNRQYVREIGQGHRANERLTQTFVRTMVLFERTLFGQHGPSREEFEACWLRMDRFHQLVQEPTGVTA